MAGGQTQSVVLATGKNGDVHCSGLGCEQPGMWGLELSGADGCICVHAFVSGEGFFLFWGCSWGKVDGFCVAGRGWVWSLSSHGGCRGKDGRRGRGKANGETLLGMSGDHEGSFFIACVHLVFDHTVPVYSHFHFVTSMFTSVIPNGLLHPNDPASPCSSQHHRTHAHDLRAALLK